MGSPICKKVIINEGGKDRISSLSDEVIHQILSFLDTQIAVQTSVLSKRWKLIWKTIPFLHFDEYKLYMSESVFKKFVIRVFSRRNHRCNIIKLKLRFFNDFHDGFDETCLEDCLKYANSHNLQDLNVGIDVINLSTFSSNSVKKLKLEMNFEFGSLEYSDCWVLPALTSLHLKHLLPEKCPNRVQESFLTCLPCLTYLCLDRISLPSSFSLPALKTLHLVTCDLPETLWVLPALTTLILADVDLPENITRFLFALVSLQDLRLFFCLEPERDYLIYCPQLLYLELRTSITEHSTLTPNVLLYAPKLCNVTILGIITITCGASNLENVNIKLRGCFGDENTITWGMLKQYCLRIYFMFPGLGSAKILTLDADTIEVLSDVSPVLRRSSSPFYNLKYVKLPHGYKESGLSDTIKSYLLGGSPGATFVTALPQNDVIPRIAPVSQTAQDVMQEEPLATPTTELVDSQGIHRKVCSDTLTIKVKEEHVVENSGIFDGKVGQVGALGQGFGELVPSAPGNDRASSSRGNNDFGLWHGHEVNSEFVDLLELIMKKYPKTFENFTTKSNNFCTMKLNMLCTSVNSLTTTAMTEIDTEMITEYRTLFSYLQSSFNIQWLVSHLNSIEQLQFSQRELHATDSCIDNATNKLQVLPTLGAEKMTKIQEAFGTMGTNLAASASYNGDDLLSDP